MNSARGIIVAVNNCGSTPIVLVEVEPGAGCARCAAGKGCGAGLFGASRRKRQIELIAPGGRDYAPGDVLGLALPGRNLLRAALLVYGLPLLGAAAGAGAALLANSSEPVAVMASLAGLAAGFLLARWRLNDAQCVRQFAPRILS
jgi:sigma-E factor negative regulatory protein RseC